MANLLYLRERGWATQDPRFVKPYKLATFQAPIKYLDERHYEVFQLGVLMREVQWEEMDSSRTAFNGMYDFDFEPLDAPHATSHRSYLIRLHVRNQLGKHTFPPEPGSQVQLQCQLDANSQAAELGGKVIASKDNNEIVMVVTRRGGQHGFILQGRRGHFRFGGWNSSFRYMKSSIRQAMYAGGGLRKYLN